MSADEQWRLEVSSVLAGQEMSAALPHAEPAERAAVAAMREGEAAAQAERREQPAL